MHKHGDKAAKKAAKKATKKAERKAAKHNQQQQGITEGYVSKDDPGLAGWGGLSEGKEGEGREKKVRYLNARWCVWCISLYPVFSEFVQV